MNKSLWQNILIFIFPCFGFALMLWVAYPGFMSPDSLDQYTQAKAGQYSDWHPPLMAWIWNKLLIFKDGPQPMLVLNNLLYWSGAALIAYKLRNFWLSFVFLLLCFAPPLINFLGVIWKDTLLFCFLFFQCGLLYYNIGLPLNRAKKTGLITVFLLIGFVCIMLRHNAASAVLPLIGLPFIFFVKKIKVGRAFLLGTMITCCLFLAGIKFNKILCNHQSDHPEQQLMVYDLMGISSALNKNVLPDYLKDKLTLDTLHKIYSPCDGAMYPFFGMKCAAINSNQYDSLKNNWKQEVLAHPYIVLRHKYRSFKCLFMSPGLKIFPYIHPNGYGFELKDNTARTYFKAYTDSKWANELYRSVIYLSGCCICFGIALLCHFYTKSPDFIFPMMVALSGILYACSYFPLSPCNDLRYNYWTIGAMFLSFLFLIGALGSKKQSYR